MTNKAMQKIRERRRNTNLKKLEKYLNPINPGLYDRICLETSLLTSYWKFEERKPSHVNNRPIIYLNLTDTTTVFQLLLIEVSKYVDISVEVRDKNHYFGYLKNMVSKCHSYEVRCYPDNTLKFIDAKRIISINQKYYWEDNVPMKWNRSHKKIGREFLDNGYCEDDSVRHPFWFLSHDEGDCDDVECAPNDHGFWQWVEAIFPISFNWDSNTLDFSVMFMEIDDLEWVLWSEDPETKKVAEVITVSTMEYDPSPFLFYPSSDIWIRPKIYTEKEK